MSLPASGYIDMYQVRDEMWYSQYGDQIHTWAIGLDQCRGLAGVGANPATISLDNLHGKASYTPMSITGTSSQDSMYQTSYSGGTAVARPSVSVSGGSGGYTYNWWIVSYSGVQPSYTNGSSSCSVSRTYTKGSNGSFTATMGCTVTDSTGHTVTVQVQAHAEWYNGQIM